MEPWRMVLAVFSPICQSRLKHDDLGSGERGAGRVGERQMLTEEQGNITLTVRFSPIANLHQIMLR